MNIDEIKELLGLTDEDLKKPLPKPTKWSQPYWDAAKKHKLVFKKCTKCGHIDHPPYLYCTECHVDDHEWVESSGKGVLNAYAVNHFGVPFPFWPDLPYVTAMVDVEEGPRMITNIVECDPEALKNGMELEVVFQERTSEFTLPQFRPVKK